MVFSGVANKVVVVCQKAKTHAYLDTFILRDRSFIRGGLGWCKWGAVIPFCAPENRGLHKIVQPFLRGHVFLCIPISVPQKRNNTEGIKSKSNRNLLSK